MTLVLHNIRSTYNVGSIMRTAEGFGVTNIICSGYTPYPKLKSDSRLPHIADKLTKQIHKTALGAENMLEIEYHEDINSWLDQTTDPLIALEQSPTSIDISDFKPPKTFNLLLGEEVEGISKDLLGRCEVCLEIPMKGNKESFNVSVAAAIALFALIT